ncbi:hypothetical protein HK102_007361, partial [Quaeritorhiza haematococci]
MATATSTSATSLMNSSYFGGENGYDAAMSSRYLVRERLDQFYHEVTTIILSKQNPATGLIPASVAVTTHGDYRDAWVRDNVYSIMAVWGLALAYRRIDDDCGRA